MNLNISTWEYFKDEVIVVLVDNLRIPYSICLCRLLEVSFPIALSFISISIQAWFLFIRQNGYKLKLQSSQFWPVGTTADHFQYSREVTGSLFEFNFILTNQRLIPKFGMKLLSAHTVEPGFVSGSISNFESLIAGYFQRGQFSQ